jgi:hypothetical protein
MRKLIKTGSNEDLDLTTDPVELETLLIMKNSNILSLPK